MKTNRQAVADAAADTENPEWTDEDFARARKFHELPAAFQDRLRGRGERGPQKAPTKVQTAVRYDREVLAHFKSAGPGWQTRMNDALKKAIEEGLA